LLAKRFGRHPDAPDVRNPLDMVFRQQLPAFIAPIVSAAFDDYLSCKQEIPS
jgi:hypothetical protein